jgi:hypothetical protein
VGKRFLLRVCKKVRGNRRVVGRVDRARDQKTIKQTQKNRQEIGDCELPEAGANAAGNH